jgi:hypothetical protein
MNSYGAHDRFQVRRSGQLDSDIAGWLARKRSSTKLQVVALAFGQSHPDRVTSQFRRVARDLAEPTKLRRDVELIVRILVLPKTDIRVRGRPRGFSLLDHLTIIGRNIMAMARSVS